MLHNATTFASEVAYILQVVAGAWTLTDSGERLVSRLGALTRVTRAPRLASPSLSTWPSPSRRSAPQVLTTSAFSFDTCLALAPAAGTMRHWAALHQHCGRLSAHQACAVMRSAPAPAMASHYVQHRPLSQRGIRLQPASVHAPASLQRCGVHSRSRSAAVCATGTDARSSTSQQQQQQVPQSDHQQQGPAAAPRWDIKMLYDGDCPLCMREVHGRVMQASPWRCSPAPV